MNSVIEARENQFFRCIPDALEHETLLYVGANMKRMELLGLFVKAKFRIDIIEIWPVNIKELSAWNEKHKFIRAIRQGDIRNMEIPETYDVVMWWHGPEHIEADRIKDVLERLEKIAVKILVLGCPFGVYKQGAEYGNPYETHHIHFTPEFFEERGFSVETIGTKNIPGSNIMAWKRIKAVRRPK